MLTVVTAVHTFVAEHGDELEFQAGEKIEVLERDDDFGDGWWRGRNEKGEEGLFPATYITEDASPAAGKGGAGAGPNDAPAPASSAAPVASAPVPEDRAASPSPPSPKAGSQKSKLSTTDTGAAAGDGVIAAAAAGIGAAAVGVSTVMGKTIGEIEHAIESIAQPPSNVDRALPARNAEPRPEHEEQDDEAEQDHEGLGIGQNARARLAAQAKLANDKLDQHRGSGGIAGLVYSDESDDEEDEPPRRRSTKPNGGGVQPTIAATLLHDDPNQPSTPPMDRYSSQFQQHSQAYPNYVPPAAAWSVDQVVEWAKSKGFEEAIWSKFHEHEISGDLLLELDANLLKELDIPQFGKRLRVAQAISELRRPGSTAASPSTVQPARMSAPPTAFIPTSVTPPTSSTPPLSQSAWSHDRKVSSNSIPPPSAMDAIHEGQKATSINREDRSSLTADKPASITSSSVPASPITPNSPAVKRESTGSVQGHKRGKGSIDKDRLSFFSRKKPPPAAAPSNGAQRSVGAPNQVHQMQPASPQQQVSSTGTAAALKQIGTPDRAGYMKKKGDNFGWKTRYFVLKGAHLYFLASEHEDRVKGHIALQGHRVIVDENTNPGSYGFRLVGPEKSHAFSSSEQGAIREWMKALMKATIARDYSVPVTSSCNIPTIPLAEAQALSPRPPSPATREATQRATRRENTNTLTPHDASILMSLEGSGRNRNSLPSRPDRDTRRPSAQFKPTTPTSPSAPVPIVPAAAPAATASSDKGDPNHPLVHWVNSVLPSQYPRATALPTSFVSGEVIFLLVRAVSGIEPNPPVPPAAFSPEADGLPGVEGLFAMMDMLIDAGVDTVGVSLNEVRTGNKEAITKLLESVKSWADK